MVTLALIGSGKWGSKYLDAVNHIPNVEIKYVVKRNYKDLLAHEDIDGIIIATPDNTHVEIAQTFPDKYLLIEKPLATSLQSALTIKNPKIMVGHIYLYNLLLMKKIKAVGRIEYFNFRLCNTQAVEETTPLFHLAPHGISLCVFLFGKPKKISAWNVNNNLFIKLQYPKTTCLIEVGWNYQKKERLIVALGDRSLVYDDTQDQEVSPLENEIGHFVKFIKGDECVTNIKHALQVQKVIESVQQLICGIGQES